MKKLLIATVLVAIVVLSGCLSALHPLFTEKDLVFDTKLVGSWHKDEHGEVYTFQKGSAQSLANLPEAMQKLADKAYVLTVTDQETGEETGEVLCIPGEDREAFLPRLFPGGDGYAKRVRGVL